MASRKLIRAVAKIAAATAFGGPVAGAGTGVAEAIDLITDGLGQRDKDAYASAMERLERDRGAFGTREGLSRASVDGALEEAQAVSQTTRRSGGDGLRPVCER